MLIRRWELSRLFENEAEGAGEGSSGAAAVETTESPASESPYVDETPASEEPAAPEPVSGVNHEENVAVVAEYFKELRGTSTAEETPTTATTTEPVTPTPVEKTSTDAAAPRSEAGRKTEGNGTADPVLIEVAKSYGLQDDELANMTAQELVNFTKVMERRWNASEEAALKAQQDKAGTPGAAPTTEAAATAPDPFEQHLAQLRERGVDVDNDEILSSIKAQHEAANAAILQLASENEQTRAAQQQQQQQFQQYMQQVQDKQLRDAVLSGVLTKLRRPELFGDGQAHPTPEQIQNYQATLQEFRTVAQRYPNESFDWLLHRAFVRSHGDKLMHKAASDYATSVLKQGKNVMGRAAAAKPSSETHWTGPIEEHPKVNRVWERMQRNRT